MCFKKIFTLYFALLITVPLAQLWADGYDVLYNDVGHINNGSRIDWYPAGLLDDTPRTASIIYNVTNHGVSPANDGQTNYASLQSLINTKSGNSYLSLLYFPAGEYNFSGTIEFDPSDYNIVLQGAGTDTELKFTVGVASIDNPSANQESQRDAIIA
ncbi:MAG: hypothetical protein GF313_05980 [Caldithrix sp.]|nr:hypothetical protein [Caldithrix sp.]